MDWAGPMKLLPWPTGGCGYGIWGDRFGGARQRLDFYHVSQHLWTVAHTLYPEEESAARAWVEPMLAKLKVDCSCEVITELELHQQRLEGAAKKQVAKEVQYLQAHRHRMEYGTARGRGEPLGSGAMESNLPKADPDSLQHGGFA